MPVVLAPLPSHLETLAQSYRHFFYFYLFDDDVAPEGVSTGRAGASLFADVYPFMGFIKRFHLFRIPQMGFPADQAFFLVFTCYDLLI